MAKVFEGNDFFDPMTFNTLTIWLIDFEYIDFWYIDKLHIWLFDTLAKETHDLLQGSRFIIPAGIIYPSLIVE